MTRSDVQVIACQNTGESVISICVLKGLGVSADLFGYNSDTHHILAHGHVYLKLLPRIISDDCTVSMAILYTDRITWKKSGNCGSRIVYAARNDSNK